MNAVSFFTGAGGLDIGLKQAGFDVKLAIELVPTYVDTVKNNYPDFNIKQGDIMDYSKQSIYQELHWEEDQSIDLMVGGSPCQSFSTAGKRDAFASEGGKAMLKYADLIEEVQPKVFLLENVRGLLSAPLKKRPVNQIVDKDTPLTFEEQRGSALEYLLTRFPSYKVNYKLLNSADFGVPQKRERVFFIGFRKDLNHEFIFPEPTHNEEGIEGKKRWITVKDAFEQLKNIKHEYVGYSAERLKYMQMIPKGGGNWRDLPEEHVREAMGGAYKSGGGKVGYFRRIDPNKPSPTILTSPHQKSTNLGHPFEDRPLSIQEYLVLQDFPKRYKLSGTLGEKYRQVGNAVPISLARVMGESIMLQLKNIR